MSAPTAHDAAAAHGTESHAQATALVQAIERETELLGALAALLQQEREVLQAGNSDALPSLSTQKAELLRAVAQTEDERRQLIRRLSGTSPTEDVQAVLDRFPAEQQLLRSRWEALLGHASRVRTLNQENGYMVELALQHVRGALDALCGDGMSKTRLYDPHGQSAPVSAHRSLGKV